MSSAVTHFGSFPFKGGHCQVMELLDANVRQIIFRNGRRGLSPWCAQKFARDILRWGAVGMDAVVVQ